MQKEKSFSAPGELVPGTLEHLAETVRHCRCCPLCETRLNAVPGEGAPRARLMFIGEGPGADEDRQGRPFVGPAGQLLDKMLYAVDISREDVYIANILKCRPPKNRDPLPAEEDACIGYLREQVALINPKVIVCLGRISAMRLIKPDFKITQEHGQWFKKGNYLMTAVYHPAAVLRDPRKKEDMLEDIKKIKEKISEN